MAMFDVKGGERTFVPGAVPPLNVTGDAGVYEMTLKAAAARENRARVDAIKRKAGKRRAIIRRAGARVGRNEPCQCGSGKKRKRCCGGRR